MESLTPASLVHFYDTHSHRIACGVRGFDQRSTKHPRQVTCKACVGVIAERSRLTTAQDEPAHAVPVTP